MTLPEAWDTVRIRTVYDTSTVIAETVYEMRPAWLTERKGEPQFALLGTSWLARARGLSLPPGIQATSVDTSIENTDTTLLWKLNYSGFNFNIDAYHIPFRVGNWWRMGIAGTYYYDVTGDSIPDTIRIWGDTTKIVGIENVVIPYGAIPNAYKLAHVARQSMHGTYQGIPVRETSYIRGWHWYKDSLGAVKDSSQTTGVIYMRMLVWLKAGNFYSQGTGVLLDHHTGQSEMSDRRDQLPRLAVFPNPFRVHTTIQLPLDTACSEPVRIYDATGKLKRSLFGNRRSGAGFVSWDGLDEYLSPVPGGIYFIRHGSSVCTVNRLQ